MKSAFFQKSKGYLAGVAAIVLVTLLLAPFQSDLNDVTAALALLVGVLFTATVFGSWPAVPAAVLGVLSFNFFFLPPLYTLDIAEPKNWVAFAAFFVTALTAGQLSSSARRRAEESEQRRREIERLYQELRGAFEQASQAEALRQSEKLKSALLDAVTHDLRTPLTSIKASVTTLLEDEREKLFDEETRAEFLEIINEETDRLNDFIEGMVGIARVEANALHLRKNWSSVEEIINNALERAKMRLVSNRVTIELEPELPNVFVDANSIAEVVYTLLDNAAKYSPADSPIRITARRANTEKTVEIAVEDRGKGIAPALREKVFSKFFRAANETSNDIHATSGGLGLGLSIARGIIESQGGKIRITDAADGFKTRFVFEIPIESEVDSR